MLSRAALMEAKPLAEPLPARVPLLLLLLPPFLVRGASNDYWKKVLALSNANATDSRSGFAVRNL